MLLNHPAPGKGVFALATLTLLRQVPHGRGEVLQSELEISPFGGKIPGKWCLACSRVSEGEGTNISRGLQRLQWANCSAFVLATVEHLPWSSSEVPKGERGNEDNS